MATLSQEEKIFINQLAELVRLRTGGVYISPNSADDFYLPNGGGFSFVNTKTKYYAGNYWDVTTYNAGSEVILASVGGGEAAYGSAAGLLLPIHLPNGSTLTAYAVYAYDNNNPGTVSGGCYKHNLITGVQTQIGSTQTSSTTGTPGNVTLSQSGLTEVIDNSTTGYSLYFAASTANTSTLSHRGHLATYTTAGSASMS